MIGHGAYICAEIAVGDVLRLDEHQGNMYRGRNDCWETHDTLYFCHSNPALDEFCVKSPNQILKWIIVITREFDAKMHEYGIYEEFTDTKCMCI